MAQSFYIERHKRGSHTKGNPEIWRIVQEPKAFYDTEDDAFRALDALVETTGSLYRYRVRENYKTIRRVTTDGNKD